MSHDLSRLMGLQGLVSRTSWLCTLASSPDSSLDIWVNSVRGALRMGVFTLCKFLRNRANERKLRPRVDETDTTSRQSPRENQH